MKPREDEKMANMEENKKTMRRTQESANGTDAEQAVFDQQKFLETLNSLVERAKKKKNIGRSNIGNGKNIIVEYSSPNIAKPFHIGHLRTTLIGNALYNTYKYLGYNTIRNKPPWRLWHTIWQNDRRL